jgi:hypothetical protein
MARHDGETSGEGIKGARHRRRRRIIPNVSNAFERAGFISLKISVLWILV